MSLELHRFTIWMSLRMQYTVYLMIELNTWSHYGTRQGVISFLPFGVLHVVAGVVGGAFLRLDVVCVLGDVRNNAIFESYNYCCHVVAAGAVAHRARCQAMVEHLQNLQWNEYQNILNYVFNIHEGNFFKPTDCILYT